MVLEGKVDVSYFDGGFFLVHLLLELLVELHLLQFGFELGVDDCFILDPGELVLKDFLEVGFQGHGHRNTILIVVTFVVDLFSPLQEGFLLD